MEWLTDPAVWLGLPTLVLLEIVLGIDNLIFIAILADKLPPQQRNRARQIGLGLALGVRLFLLASIFWLTTLTTPLFTAFGHAFAGRDLILLVGGLFLLLKATVEIHERLEARQQELAAPAVYARFATVVAQIVVLDAIFSLDSVLTAVGMTDRLALMMGAVVIAVALMIVASKRLAEFVTAHPPLIILCLGFLLMVGFSLVADGLGFYIPKGYLYAAIGFSVLIEAINQLSLRNRQRGMTTFLRREGVARAVLRLVGGVPAAGDDDAAANGIAADGSGDDVFSPTEKEMVRGVLSLADRLILSIMTPRSEVIWIDLEDTRESNLALIGSSPHAQLLASRGSIDEVVGIVRKEDLLDLYLAGKAADIETVIRPPKLVPQATSILNTLESFKVAPVHMAIVVDERGLVQGVVTQTDLLEAIAGDLS